MPATACTTETPSPRGDKYFGSWKKYLTSIFLRFSKKKHRSPNDSMLFLSIGVPDGREMPQFQGLSRRDKASKGERVTYT